MCQSKGSDGSLGYMGVKEGVDEEEGGIGEGKGGVGDGGGGVGRTGEEEGVACCTCIAALVVRG